MKDRLLSRLNKRNTRELIPFQLVDSWLFFLSLLVTVGILIANFQESSQSIVENLVIFLTTISLFFRIYNTVLLIKFLAIPFKEKKICYKNVKKFPTVAFIIPSYHEPFEVAKMTFDCARDINYPGPREIIVVDNSKNIDSTDYLRWRNYVEAQSGLTQNTQITFSHNEKEGGLKAGNLDLAQELIREAEYVVFLDIDSTLMVQSSILEESILEFTTDSSLGFIQFHTLATNGHFNSLAETSAIIHNSFRIYTTMRSNGGFPLFYGHNGIFRKSALDQLGPWLERFRGDVIVSEDFAKSIKIYNLGYYGKYKTICAGEWTPLSLEAIDSMWMRWTYGSYQAVFKYLPSVLASKNYLFSEKVDFLCMTADFFLSNVVLLILPLWLFYFSPERVAYLSILTVYVVPILLGVTTYKHRLSRSSMPFWRKIWLLFTAFFVLVPFIYVTQMKAAIKFLTGRKQDWRVTSKSIESIEALPPWRYIIWRHIVPIGMGSLLLLISISMWGYRYNFSKEYTLLYFPTIFFSLSLFLSIVLFGRSGRSTANQTAGATVDEYFKRNWVRKW
jgi:hypothetical protein